MTKAWLKYLAILVFLVGVLLAAYIVAGRALADPGPTYDPLPPISNGLPTTPPPLPTYIVNGDGTRTPCMAIDQALSCGW